MSGLRNRPASLVPKYITIRCDENKLGIEYKVRDENTGKAVSTAYIHFEPSKELMEKLEQEIETAIKNKEEK